MRPTYEDELANETFTMDASGGDGINEQPVPDDLPQASPVPQELTALLPSPNAMFRPRIVHNSLFYTTSITHRGNCLIYFYPEGDKTASPVPASIEYMWCHNQTTRLAVRQHQPIKVGTIDPFEYYRHFPASLYSSELGKLEVVKIDWIRCHFARYALGENVVVLSLYRVS